MRPSPRCLSLPAFTLAALLAGVSASSAETAPNLLLVDPVFSLDRIRIQGAPPDFDTDSLHSPLKNSLLFNSWMHKLARELENEAGLPKNFILFQALGKDYVNGFRLRGYLDAKASVEAGGEPGKRILDVTLDVGERFACRGVFIDPAVPAAFRPRLRMALGLDPEALEALRKEQALGEKSTARNVLPGAKGEKRWFGSLALLSPSLDMDDPIPFPDPAALFDADASDPPGFFEDTLIETIHSLQEEAELLAAAPEVPFPLDKSWREDATQLVGEEAARRGFPGVQVTAVPVRGKDGTYRVRVGIEGAGVPLRFGELRLRGVTLHKPEKVKTWLAEKAGLAPGTLLTTERLVKAKRVLLDSCSFYDVGVRPSALSGKADLLVTLRDSPRLPLLGAVSSPEQRILRQVGRFFGDVRSITLTGRARSQTPKGLIRATVQGDDRAVRLRIDGSWMDGNVSLHLESRDGLLLFHHAPDAPPLARRLPVRGQVAFLGQLLVEPKKREDNSTEARGSFGFGLGMSAGNSVGSVIRLESLLEPAALLLDEETGGNDLSIASDSPAETVLIRTDPKGEKRRIVIRKKDGVVTSLRVNADGVMDGNGTRVDYSILLTSSPLPPVAVQDAPTVTPLPALDFWKAVGRRSGELFRGVVERHAPELREDLPVPPNAMPALMEQLVVPLLHGIASGYVDDEEEDALAAQRSPQGKWYFRSNLHSLLRDAPGETNFEDNFRAFLEDTLHWKEGTWPNRLAGLALNLYFGRSQTLFKDLNALLQDDSIGPLGNMALARLCGIIGIAQAEHLFTLKARRSMGWLFVWEDLEALGVAQRLSALFASLPQGAVLRQILPEDERDAFDGLHARIRAETGQAERAKLTRSLAYLLYQAHFRQKLLDALTNSLEGKFQ